MASTKGEKAFMRAVIMSRALGGASGSSTFYPITLFKLRL
eukprot:UN13040